jgi:hypothetical protein
VRERWFGATGRRVPEIALEGTVDLDGALVMDGPLDEDVLREAHGRGTPVAVRAHRLESIAAALARPEVACVLVTDARLLDVDLTEHTYG